jgi:hypothetical protein
MFELLERYLDPTYRQQLLDLQRRNWRYIVIEQFLRGDLSDADSTLKGYASWAVERDMDVVDELQKLRRFRMAVQIFPRRVRRRALRLFAPRLSD